MRVVSLFMANPSNDYGYIAYIDEAGDPGLKKVRPIDENGASEWLVLSAVLMRAKWEPHVINWVDQIRCDLDITQARALHYRNLSPTRKLVMSKKITELPLRGFVVCSNKKNMRRYSNPKAALVPSQEWFYNWMIRVLLERVTSYCDTRTIKDYGERKKVKIEFSQRGGHSYGQTKAYYWYLKQQHDSDNIFLKKRQPVMDLLSPNLMEFYPHYTRAGMQLSDCIASSFYQAIDCLGPGTWNMEPAKTLDRILPKELGKCADFSVVLQPTPPWKADLTPNQKLIFEHYGYDFVKW